jgi:apolipoprotein N-acyltransferase
MGRTSPSPPQVRPLADSAEALPLAHFVRLIPALSGALIAAGFLDSRFYPLAWVAFAPLLWALASARSGREVLITSVIAGVITNILGFYWLVYTIHVFGGFPYPVALFFFACLTAYSTIQFVLFGLAFARIGWGPLGLAPAAIWTTLEFLYPNLFPWRMAHTQFPVVSLMQIGDLTGPYGLSLVMVWASAAVVMLVSGGGRTFSRRVAPGAAVAATVAGIIAYGLGRISAVEAVMQTRPEVPVALVQGNVGIKEKGDVRYFDVNLERYRELTAVVQDQVALAIWPETVSLSWTAADSVVLDGETHPFPDVRTYLIYGGLAFRPTSSGEVEEYNSAFLVSPEGELLARYDKQILMPFGEYLPFATWIPAIKQFSPHSGGFTAGHQARILHVPGVGRLGPLICFEDLPASIPRAMTLAGAEILFAIANDAWYGESAAPYEHQALALWRAIENRRYLLRINNTGVTSVIDPLGRVVAELPIFTAQVLSTWVRPMQIISVYTRVGDAFGWGVVVACAVLLARRRLIDEPAS